MEKPEKENPTHKFYHFLFFEFKTSIFAQNLAQVLKFVSISNHKFRIR